MVKLLKIYMGMQAFLRFKKINLREEKRHSSSSFRAAKAPGVLIISLKAIKIRPNTIYTLYINPKGRVQPFAK